MVPPVAAPFGESDLLTGDLVAERWDSTTPRADGVHGTTIAPDLKSPVPCPVSPSPCSDDGCEQSPVPCPVSPSPCSDDGCIASPSPCSDTH